MILQCSLSPWDARFCTIWSVELSVTQYCRGYQKSIIEKELEDQRKDQGKLWQQTKESIIEAREILKSSDSITGDLMREKMRDAGKMKHGTSKAGKNGTTEVGNNGMNQAENTGHQNGNYARIPLDEGSLDILKG